MSNKFIENANKCAYGDISAMRWMYRYFEEKLPDHFLSYIDRIFAEHPAEEAVNMLKELLSNVPETSSAFRGLEFWVNRAAFYGDSQAAEYIRLHPFLKVCSDFPQEFYFGNVKMRICCSGEFFRQIGIFSIDDSTEFTLDSLNKYRMFRLTEYVGYEGPDEDGYGMEDLYDISFYDEFFNPLLKLHKWSNRDVETSWKQGLRKDSLAKKAEFARRRDEYWTAAGDTSFRYRVPSGCLVENGSVIGYIGSAEIKEDIILPKGVTAIDNKAFIGCESIRSITFPGSIEAIGEEAFRGSGLESFEWPVSLSEIPSKTFWHCHNLKHVIIPDGVTKIGYQAFLGCWELEEIYIPDSVVEISEGAFQYCRQLKSFHWSASVHAVPKECFSGCFALKQITLTDGVSVIGEDAFAGCSALNSITLPENVLVIEQGAFRYCSGLVHVKWPKTVPVIAQETFAQCKNLKTVVIPSTVQKIHPKAFYGCKNVCLKKSNWMFSEM